MSENYKFDALTFSWSNDLGDHWYPWTEILRSQNKVPDKPWLVATKKGVRIYYTEISSPIECLRADGNYSHLQSTELKYLDLVKDGSTSLATSEPGIIEDPGFNCSFFETKAVQSREAELARNLDNIIMGPQGAFAIESPKGHYLSYAHYNLRSNRGPILFEKFEEGNKLPSQKTIVSQEYYFGAILSPVTVMAGIAGS